VIACEEATKAPRLKVSQRKTESNFVTVRVFEPSWQECVAENIFKYARELATKALRLKDPQRNTDTLCEPWCLRVFVARIVVSAYAKQLETTIKKN
jgi:hypothetical protein